jgi:hypothetical protein
MKNVGLGRVSASGIRHPPSRVRSSAACQPDLAKAEALRRDFDSSLARTSRSRDALARRLTGPRGNRVPIEHACEVSDNRIFDDIEG